MRAGNGKGKKDCSEGTLGKYILWLKKCRVVCTHYRVGMGVAKPGEGLVSLELVVWEWCAGCCVVGKGLPMAGSTPILLPVPEGSPVLVRWLYGLLLFLGPK